ncbi:MAG TPA: hypothetical protein VK009_15075 [Chloroflexota bacterium]|nr:hypothetical protein [Chloroflexota bacterium]
MSALWSITALTRQPAVVDAIMAGLPYLERRWCGMDRCECSGCVNRYLSREEWDGWFERQKEAVCTNCDRAVRVVARDGKVYLACETCDVYWS